ncbi:LysM peptidoglycan-binding domain-containing protein [Megamonas funiformis]|uniref:LysM peptidoglycan-binding domain-containing protein n=1 Tax=Megamonas funiformis TaxID=437897 RepID=UPI00265F009A|nr:LysM peptidoglycan-binding domain-containing protein [Megamonas funiformis]
MYKKLMLLGLAGAITLGGLSVLENKTPPKVEIEYVVQEGDTLWSIAADHIDTEDNILSEIHYIKQKNDLNSAELTVGQKIKIDKKIDSSVNR